MARVVGGEARHARGVDDAAMPLGLHDPGRGADAEEDPAEMDGDGEVEHRHVESAIPATEPGLPALLNMQSRPPKVSTAMATAASTSCLLGDVGVDEAGVLAELVRHALAPVVIEVGHDDSGPLCGEQPCCGFTDATGSTGDDRTASLESSHRPSLDSRLPGIENPVASWHPGQTGSTVCH